MYEQKWFFSSAEASAFAESIRNRFRHVEVRYMFAFFDTPNWQVIWW